MAGRISTTELSQQLGQPDLMIIDVRPTAAYNGWSLAGEARGGHIRGAVACPLSWSESFALDSLAGLLKAKGLEPGKRVVLYGYAGDDCTALASQLASMGHHEVWIYQAGLEEWAADESRPMARLPHYEKLVYPGWVRQLIDGEKPPTASEGGYLLFHINYGVPEEYAHSHLPGAMHLDTNRLESATDWNRRSPAELEEALNALGITHDRMVVLYGRDTEPAPDEPRPGRSAGQIAATRAAAILMYAGVEDVRLLDGGYDAWVAAGYPVEKEPHLPRSVKHFGAPIPGRPDYFVDLPEAKELIADPGGVLVSIRSWPEFIGDTSGYNYIGPAGRISGAVWGNCGTDAYHMENYRSLDNTMREYREIDENWREVGITPDKRIAFYCGTGWRASETFFYAYLMGYPRVAIYDGGWFEWSSDPANPTETGIPEDMVYQP